MIELSFIFVRKCISLYQKESEITGTFKEKLIEFTFKIAGQMYNRKPNRRKNIHWKTMIELFMNSSNGSAERSECK